MGWEAHLHNAEDYCLGEWSYTHNCNRMLNAALGIDPEPKWSDPLPAQLDGRNVVMVARPLTWIERLAGLPGPTGAALLHGLITTLERDPLRFQEMNPESGWGDYDTILATLIEMRNSVPEYPTRWMCFG